MNKNVLLNCLCFIWMLASLSGCKKKELSPKEYVLWVRNEENGLHKKKIISDYIFDIQYKPLDYIVTNELRGDIRDKKIVDQRIKNLEGMQYFDLTIKMKDGKDFIENSSSDQQDFYNKLYYMSFDFQKDISLEEGENTIPCDLFHFERSYDLRGGRTFVLGFKNDKESNADKTLVINTKTLGLGIVRIKIDQENIQDIPFLKYE